MQSLSRKAKYIISNYEYEDQSPRITIESLLILCNLGFV